MMFFVKTLLVGFSAALCAWLLNRLLLHLGVHGVPALLGPVIEETLKTGLALAAGASLAGVHSTFGLIEGLWELPAGTPPGAPAAPVRGYPGAWIGPALAAWGGHSFFGLLVLLTYTRTGHPGTAWAMGLLAHLAWNRAVLALHR
ncbi:hypothetical protein [Neomoorella thermoacetica]|uniref:hypothetical protein n=1 Tax=Neomoorella thermoacetica TaxID=1525 RepID=UPI0018C8BFE7|nr:hypothetical protein [Moorella thermoacetica]